MIFNKPAAADITDIDRIETPPAATLEVLPDPHAGGNYLRDPVTGALSLNPAFETPTFQE